jgi:hypothetical protein
MGPRRSNRSRVLRAVALGAAVAPVGIAWGVASCILADPPPSLPTIPPLLPQIQVASVVPPPSVCLTNWPEGAFNFVVPVLVPTPNVKLNAVVIEDYGEPASKIVDIPAISAPLDGGSLYEVPLSVPKPVDTSCHTISFWTGDSAWSTTDNVPATLACTECWFVEWVYDPSGTCNCSIYDAGGLPTAPDAAVDVVLKID